MGNPLAQQPMLAALEERVRQFERNEREKFDQLRQSVITRIAESKETLARRSLEAEKRERESQDLLFFQERRNEIEEEDEEDNIKVGEGKVSSRITKPKAEDEDANMEVSERSEATGAE